MQNLKFTKMHGLGNDFMVINATNQTFDAASAPIAAWADRHTGIGFDQLLLVEPPRRPDTDFRYRIFNADGSEVEQCGNGARCFARFVREQGLSSKLELTVETAKGVIVLKLDEGGEVTVDMGAPRLAAAEIPFLPASDEAAEAVSHWLSVGLEAVPISVVNMGNPQLFVLPRINHGT